MLPTTTRAADERVHLDGTSIPFLVAHAVPLLSFVTGVTTKALLVFAVSYVARAFFITAGYHRYFAHRSYRLGRVSQFVMAFGGAMAAQKGPLWWAAHHRDHHKYADTDRDPHSPQKGFVFSHVGWILSPRYKATKLENIEDFARFPELRFINKHDWIAPWSLGVVSFLVAGWSGLVFGFFGSTVLLWHATFSINSFAHLFGRRRYGTADTSRNNVPLAILTLGEGWHNNHHHHPSCARQGFRWWEVDISYYVLRLLSFVGIVRDLRKPAPAAKAARRLRAGQPDVGLLRFHLSRAASTVNRRGVALPPEVTRQLLDELSSVADRAATAARSTRQRISERAVGHETEAGAV